MNQESLRLRRELGDTPGVATLLNNLGIIARFQRDLDGARQMNEESLTLFREMGDRWAGGMLLNNQACVASDQGEYAEDRVHPVGEYNNPMPKTRPETNPRIIE